MESLGDGAPFPPPTEFGGEVIPGEVVPRAPILVGTAILIAVPEGVLDKAGDRAVERDGEGTLSLHEPDMFRDSGNYEEDYLGPRVSNRVLGQIHDGLLFVW